MENILERMYQSALKFLVPLQPQETYSTIVKEAAKLVKAEFGSIFLAKGRVLRRVYSSVPEGSQVEPRQKGYTYKVFLTSQPLTIPIKEFRKAHPKYTDKTIKSVIEIPLSYSNQSLGVLALQSSRSDHFTDEKLHILKLFGSMASLAIRKAQLYSEVQSALEVRDAFISMAAHELRTPLTTISGYVQLFNGRLSAMHPTEATWIKELSSETNRLTQLVNELLDVHKIKIGKLEYIWKECGVKEIIRRALINFSFRYPHRKIIFSNNLSKNSDLVVGDFDKLLQSILNILYNADKFSPADKEIIVNLRNQPKHLTLEIQDQGSGISKREQRKIFDWFYKGGNQTKGGMGMGLSLAHMVVEKHRGLITVTSTLGKGTKVAIKLPKVKHA